MMQFEDFRIRITSTGNWLNAPKGEKVQETLLRINNWVEENEHLVLNIETLFFPGLDSPYKKTVAPTFTAGDADAEYFQVFRVWFKKSHFTS